MWRDVIDLVDYEKITDEYGDTIETPSYTQIFANKKSVGRSEFYQAMANGLEPELVFEVMSIDYSNQSKIRYKVKETSDPKLYDVIRSFDRGEITELVVQGVVNKNANA